MRSDRRMMRVAAIVIAAFALAPAAPGAADQGPAGIEGCVVTATLGTPYIAGIALHVDRCRYVATRRAGYAATGDEWSIIVRRKAEHRTVTYSSSNGASHVCDAVIHEGDVVTVTATGDGLAAAGNPVLAALDFLPTDTGKCVG
ncbi:MAG: hypothetical protein QOD50_1869 [Actinomycetota bacterium]|nr:hypothetical protein [Actinomycetota bacterium]